MFKSQFLSLSASLIAFGVTYNSSRIALSERARALASLRVLGFTRGEVAYILLGELGIQALIALPVGCLLGYGLALLMSPILNTDMYSFPLIIDDSTYGFSVIVVAVFSCHLWFFGSATSVQLRFGVSFENAGVGNGQFKPTC